jgi:hypothetical protein
MSRPASASWVVRARHRRARRAAGPSGHPRRSNVTTRACRARWGIWHFHAREWTISRDGSARESAPPPHLNDDLSCQVTHTGDTGPEFFGGTDPGTCGTFFATDDPETRATLYGSSAAGGASVDADFTPVSQSAVTGSGTVGDPHQVVTQVDVLGFGDTTLAHITQTDSYVVGDETYRTDIQVHNPGFSTLDGTLYHAERIRASDPEGAGRDAG